MDPSEFTRAQPDSVPGSPGKLNALGRTRVRQSGAGEVDVKGAQPVVSSKHVAIGVEYLEALGALDEKEGMVKKNDPFWDNVISAAKETSSKTDNALGVAKSQPTRALSSSATSATSAASAASFTSAPKRGNHMSLSSPSSNSSGSSPSTDGRRAAPQASSSHVSRTPVVTTSATSRSTLRKAPASSRSFGTPMKREQRSPSVAPFSSSSEVDARIADVEQEFRENGGRRKGSLRSTEMMMCDDPFLQLSLDSMDLVDFPTALTLDIVNNGSCCHLTHLHLKGNRIVNLPPAIGQLSELVELNVEDNLLTTLPRDIQHLKKLQRLHANGNKISMIPAELFDCQQLRRLFLGNNRILKLPPDVARLKQLRWLDVSSNLLCALPNEISSLPRLGWLDVSSNQITRLPVDLGNLRSLCSLNLLKNPLDPDRALPLNIMEIKSLMDVRVDMALNIPSALLSERDTFQIHSFLTDMIQRWDLQLNDRSHWEPNDATSKCRACAITFTLTKRRHHCRICGLIFCHKDCCKTLDIPVMGIGRVCEDCCKKLDPSNPANQYRTRLRAQEEAQAAKTYGLSAADETMPLEHRIKLLEGQIQELTEKVDAVFRSQDALQKMREIYENDAESLADADRQINEEKQKLRGLMITKSRVQAMLAALTDEKEAADESD